MWRPAWQDIQDEIASAQRSIEEAHSQIHRAESRIEELTKLSRYGDCPKCGAELEGGVETAREVMQAAKSIGREDVPCAFCDTPEQREAFEKALERVQR